MAPEPSPQPSAEMTQLLGATPATLATSERSDWPVKRPLDDASAPAMSVGTHAAPGMASVTSTASAPWDTDGSGDGDGDGVADAVCDTGVPDGEGDAEGVGEGVEDRDVLAVVYAHTLCPTAPVYVPNAHGAHVVDSAVTALKVFTSHGVHATVPLALGGAKNPAGHGWHAARALESPGTTPKVPPGQGTHVTRPTVPYVPALHGEQADAPGGLVEPAGHWLQG